jgi:hypothetical protein
MAEPISFEELQRLAPSTTPGTWLLNEAANYQGEADLVGASIETKEVFIAEIRGAVEIAGNRHEEHTANARWVEATQPERLLPLLAQACWQTIDKAPRDGTEVDLWRDGRRLVGYWWDINRQAWITEYGYPVVTNVLTKPPTHFMIPAPGPTGEAA